ncbi:MAG TPA: GIY-YIG nuclease family protein [Flavobacterium sp.]
MRLSYVYFFKCSDVIYYVGVTSDPEDRMLKHNTGFYEGSYTSSRKPLELVFYCEFTDINLVIDKVK